MHGGVDWKSEKDGVIFSFLLYRFYLMYDNCTFKMGAKKKEKGNVKKIFVPLLIYILSLSLSLIHEYYILC